MILKNCSRSCYKMTEPQKKTTAEYRAIINQLGKKEFTLLKMQEYGFWPKHLPTPYERQENETPEMYAKRQELMKKYQKTIDQIADLYKEKDDINLRLRQLAKQYDETWDIEKIRKDVAQQIMKESKERRAERKRQRELEKQQKAEAWKKRKSEEIVFVGKGYSSFLYHSETNQERLTSKGLPIITTDRDLASFLGLEFKELRFLTYHRDVVLNDHYFRYKIPKRSGGQRSIAAPKRKLKHVQRIILDNILSLITLSKHAHGFIKEKSVITGAKEHPAKPALVINIDLEDFFPTITFERIRGMFHGMGYSGNISTLLAMLCTYCERTAIEVKGKTRYVATTRRILPQGSPASPMITNIICRRLDFRLAKLANTFHFTYTRYADDMSFVAQNEENINIGRFLGLVNLVVKEEGFKINENKTRFLRKNNRQEITGVVINNEQLAIPRKWIRKFRAAIYNANKMKLAGEFLDDSKRELAGMASWIKSVNPARYSKLIAAAIDILK